MLHLSVCSYFEWERQRTESLMRTTRAKWQICPLISARSSCELTCYIDLQRVCTYRLSESVLPGLETGWRSSGKIVSTRTTPTFQKLTYEIIDKTFIRYRIAILFSCWATCKSTHVPLLTTTVLLSFLFSPADVKFAALAVCKYVCVCVQVVYWMTR